MISLLLILFVVGTAWADLQCGFFVDIPLCDQPVVDECANVSLSGTCANEFETCETQLYYANGSLYESLPSVFTECDDPEVCPADPPTQCACTAEVCTRALDDDDEDPAIATFECIEGPPPPSPSPTGPDCDDDDEDDDGACPNPTDSTLTFGFVVFGVQLVLLGIVYCYISGSYNRRSF